MAKGKNRGSQGQSGGANRQNILAAKAEASIGDQIRPGRHACSCQARIHGLILNCMGCGKIVCEQEGSGPCFYCGTLVCTRKEREILDLGTRKSAELMQQLMGSTAHCGKGLSLSSIGKDLEKATQFRNRLLEADADSERRTKVNDLESDYSSVENNAFLSPEEREHIVRRRADLQRMREERKRALVFNLSLVDGSVEEQKGNLRDTDPAHDPVIRSILDKSEERRRAADAAFNSAVDARWVPKGFVPKYDDGCGTKFPSNVVDFVEVDNMAMLNDEVARLEVERKGYGLTLPQPFAALVAHGVIRQVCWPEDLHLKGPVYISSSAQPFNSAHLEPTIKKFSNQSHVTSTLIDYSSGSLMGRVYLDDCVTKEDFKQEFGSCPLAGSGDFVLNFSACEPLTIPIPHLPPSTFYQLDKELKSALDNVLCG